MADHGGLVEVVERDAVDPGQDAFDLHESRFFAPREVDLRLVAGDDDLRIHAEPREKHFHLQDGRVLRFVQDHERVGQCAPPHERERGNLDGTGLERPLDALGRHHRVQRVVERPQVGVNLRLHVAREEAQVLACLDRWPGQDDPAHPLARQCVHGRGHGEIGLARPGGPDADDDIVVGDLSQVLGLSWRFRRDDGADARQCDTLALGDRGCARTIRARVVVHPQHIVRRDWLPLARQLDHALRDRDRSVD